jgi:hypothetical protein
VESVLFAEPAILVHFKSVGIVFLVFCGIVVSLLAFRASQGNLYSHDGTSRFTEKFSLPLTDEKGFGAKK